MKMPQHCFAVKLQQCSVDDKTSTDFPSAWIEEIMAHFLIFGWTYPLSYLHCQLLLINHNENRMVHHIVLGNNFFDALINTFSLFIWTNKLNKLKHIWYCFTLFICGGPCCLSTFKQCSVDLILPVSTACLFRHDKINISEFAGDRRHSQHLMCGMILVTLQS